MVSSRDVLTQTMSPYSLEGAVGVMVRRQWGRCYFTTQGEMKKWIPYDEDKVSKDPTKSPVRKRTAPPKAPKMNLGSAKIHCLFPLTPYNSRTAEYKLVFQFGEGLF